MDAQRWKQVRAEFDALVELDVAERSARLEAIGGADPELRRSVESLLAADAAADARLGGIEASFLRAAPPATDEVDPPVADPFGLAGRTLSHFRVLELLETGGMGVVYRAEDLALNRAVALKFLLPQYSLEESAKARFLEEARAAAALDHPNLCTVHEIGESEDQRLFLAMPLYQGETLRARLARGGPLPVEEALQVARQVAEGLGCAHAAGVIHRDLKPGNLLLTSGGGVKILDFGVARVRDRKLTGPGLVVGTVAYMAPEQLRNEPVDARTDLWALGVVLYEMLTGRHPFDAGHDVEVARAILHEEPAPPSALRRDLPPAVEALVATLLQKSPAERPGSAEELLARLAGLATSGVHAPSERQRSPHPRPGASRARLPGGLRPALLLILALIALGALGAAGLAPRLLRSDGVPAERSIAVLPFDYGSAAQDAYFADGVTEEILLALANVGELRVISRTSVMRYREAPKTVGQIADELDVAYVVEGSIRRAEGRVRITATLIDARTDRQLWAQSFDRPMRDVFAVQSEIARRIAHALHARVSAGELARIERMPTTSLEAHDYFLQGRAMIVRDLPPDVDAGVALLRKARALDPTYPEAYASLSHGFTLRYLHRADRAYLDSAVVAAREAVRLDPDFPEGHVRLGWALNLQGEREAALEAQLRAVQLNPSASFGLANLYAYDFGRLDEAARLWVPALRTDPTSGSLNWQVARTYLHLGMPEKAGPLLERAVEFNPQFPLAHYTLVSALVLEGRAEEARTKIQEMLAAIGGTPEAIFFAGLAAAQLGDLPAARRYLEQGRVGGWLLWDAQGTLLLAWILQGAGEEERARPLVQRAAAGFARWSGGGPRRPEDFVNLARVRILEGDREDALRQLETAVRRGWRLVHDQPGDPILGSLRGEPRYERLRAEVRADLERQRARVERQEG